MTLAIEYWPLERLTPNPRNAKLHPPEQVAKLAGLIQEFGFRVPIQIRPDGMVLAGHGRLAAARRLGLEEVPAIVISDLSDVQLRLFAIADNRIQAEGGWDTEILAMELRELEDDYADLTLSAFDQEELDALLAEVLDKTEAPEPPAPDDTYTKRIEAPIYVPKGERPTPETLFDDARAQDLLREIRAADLPEDVEAFLVAAAQRHTVFNFARIAEFYAHADGPLQELMENSALVLIDFDRAVERGFVKLTERLAEQYQAGGDDAE